MLDCSKCLPKSIRNKNNIILFAKDLVRNIDMVPFGEPQVQHFGSGNKAGYTLVQLIETSNITAHFCEETDDIYLDVFSCKPFKISTVRSTVDTFFSPTFVSEKYTLRQAPIENEKVCMQPRELK
jgi:hypothetical protein